MPSLLGASAFTPLAACVRSALLLVIFCALNFLTNPLPAYSNFVSDRLKTLFINHMAS
ncbi:hypothetical protein SynROS8604_01448 [Synechococcus sp. ROS8604]|nr:hypothetical protein SynROS8604_01448 [Synechococcus sp. ROS8604]